MFVDEIKASVNDWHRRWYGERAAVFVRRFEDMQPEEQEACRVDLETARVAMRAIHIRFQRMR